MTQTYRLNGEEIDSMELKTILITRGMNVPSNEIHEHFANTRRVLPFSDPMACNCLLLPDNTIAHILWPPFSLQPGHEYNQQSLSEL